MTLDNPPRNRWRTIACILWGFLLGFSEAAPGALLPYMEEYYSINYAEVSCIWVSNAVGFIIIALVSDKIEPLLGKQKALLVSCVFNVIMYALVASGTVFPVIVVGFLFGGMGAGIGLAQSNVFLSRMQRKARLLSFLHAAYGIGATVSPLIATAIVNAGIAWHYFYLILLGLYLVNGINLFMSFGNAHDLLPWQAEGEVLSGNLMPAVRAPVTWYLSLFLFFYQGAEVAMAGWIVTFLLDYRHGDPSTVGYVALGFWGGLTIGRLVLTNMISRYSIRRGVFIVSLLSIMLVFGVGNPQSGGCCRVDMFSWYFYWAQCSNDDGLLIHRRLDSPKDSGDYYYRSFRFRMFWWSAIPVLNRSNLAAGGHVCHHANLHLALRSDGDYVDALAQFRAQALLQMATVVVIF